VRNTDPNIDIDIASDAAKHIEVSKRWANRQACAQVDRGKACSELPLWVAA